MLQSQIENHQTKLALTHCLQTDGETGYSEIPHLR